MPKPAVNWDMVGPTFLDADARKNEHELNPTGILDVLCMMIHLKLFIPLSMLTTAALMCIRFMTILATRKFPSAMQLASMHFMMLTSLLKTHS